VDLVYTISRFLTFLTFRVLHMSFVWHDAHKCVLRYLEGILELPHTEVWVLSIQTIWPMG